MADKDFKIRINTEANAKPVEDLKDEVADLKQETEGLADAQEKAADGSDWLARATEQASESASNSETATRRQQRALRDVDEARRRVANRASDAHREEMGRLAGATARYGAYGVAISKTLGAAGQAVLSMIEELRQVDPEAAKAFSKIEGYAKLAADPVGEVFNGVLNWAAGDPQKAIEELKRSMEAAVQIRSELAAMVLSQGQEEIAALNEQARAMDLASKIAQERAQAAAALNRANDTSAIADGADESAVRKSRLEQDLADKIANLDESLRPLFAKVEEIDGQVRIKDKNLEDLIYVVGPDGPGVKEAQAELAALRGTQEKLVGELNEQIALNTERMNTLKADAAEAMNELMIDVRSGLDSSKEEVSGQITEAAKGALDEVASLADQNTRFYASILQRLVEDTTPDEQQADQIMQAMTQLRDAAALRDGRFLSMLSDNIATAQSAVDQLAQLAASQAETQRQLQVTRRQVEELSHQIRQGGLNIERIAATVR